MTLKMAFHRGRYIWQSKTKFRSTQFPSLATNSPEKGLDLFFVCPSRGKINTKFVRLSGKEYKIPQNTS